MGINIDNDSYAPLSRYTLTKLPILPLVLLLGPFILGPNTTFSKPLVSTSFLSLAGLLLICLRQPAPAAPTDTLIMGLISSLFSALYPLCFLRLRDNSTTSTSDISNTYDLTNGQSQSRHSIYRILTHLAPLTTVLLLPLLLFSGELPDVRRNCYILDVLKFWIPVIGGMFSSFGAFVITTLLIDATGPIALVVVGITRAGFLLLKLEGGGAGILGWSTWVGGVVGATVCLIMEPRRGT